MKCIRAMCGVSITDRVRNEEVRRRGGSELSIGKRMDRNMLRWYDHVEETEEEIVIKIV
jgi:hypothetical protein